MSPFQNFAAMPRSANLPQFSQIESSIKLLEQHDRLPILVTGVAGVAGFNAFAWLRQRYGDQVIGQRPVNNWPLAAPGIVGVDLDCRTSTKALFQRFQFKSVLNCGGSCRLKGCELDPSMAQRVNVSSVKSILEEIPAPTRLIHLSIDLVFSGTRGGNHVESDPTDPVTVYGRTMVQAENEILAKRDDACILRISLPMGISFNGHAGAIDWIQARFAANKPATLYFDEVRTPTYVECLNEVLEEVLVSNLSGVFHAGGPRKLSLYEIAQIVNKVGGYDPNLLIGCPRIDAGPIPPRAGNVTMDSSALERQLGRAPFRPWPLDPNLVPDTKRWHFARDRQAGSIGLIKNQLYFRPERQNLELGL